MPPILCHLSLLLITREVQCVISIPKFGMWERATCPGAVFYICPAT